MVVLTYGLFYNKNWQEWITIEAARYDEQTKLPISWAVRRGNSVMSKLTGDFDYEPLPSNRDDNFYIKYRFTSPEAAAKCWSYFYSQD